MPGGSLSDPDVWNSARAPRGPDPLFYLHLRLFLSSAEQKRRALDLLFERRDDFERRNLGIEIVTDDHYADGVYQYLQLARKDSARAATLLSSLWGRGADVLGAGLGMAGIDLNGDVHPDTHWTNWVLGNVGETPFSRIWQHSSDPLLQGLRNRLPLLKGRCANCHWKRYCALEHARGHGRDGLERLRAAPQEDRQRAVARRRLGEAAVGGDGARGDLVDAVEAAARRRCTCIVTACAPAEHRTPVPTACKALRSAPGVAR